MASFTVFLKVPSKFKVKFCGSSPYRKQRELLCIVLKVEVHNVYNICNLRVQQLKQKIEIHETSQNFDKICSCLIKLSSVRILNLRLCWKRFKLLANEAKKQKINDLNYRMMNSSNILEIGGKTNWLIYAHVPSIKNDTCMANYQSNQVT